MNKNVLLVVVALLALVFLVWYIYHRHEDCSFSGWKQTVGVEIDVAVKDVQDIRSKVGITDNLERDFDILMKDFALKYDAACQDVRQGRMTQAEYLCRRNNMDKTLDKIRAFLEKIAATKTLTDVSAQREIILKAVDDLESSSKFGYGAGCTSTMLIDPKHLNFANHTLEAVQISTSGNNPLVFSAASVPSGFIAQPKTGTVNPGNLAVVAVYRTFEPVAAARPLTFHMLSNFQEDVPVQIDMDEQNSELYDGLARQARSAAAAQNRQPSIEDVLMAVDKSFGSTGSVPPTNLEAMRYFLAAGVLSRLGRATQAREALDMATAKNPSLAHEPSAFLLRGVVLNQEGHPDQALERFAEAKRIAPEGDKDTKALSDFFSGAVVLKTDKKAGTDMLSKPEVRESIERNPKLLKFATSQLHVENLDKAVEKPLPTPH